MKGLISIINALVSTITPELRTILEDAVGKLEAHANETPNPWDNIFVSILKSLLGL